MRQEATPKHGQCGSKAEKGGRKAMMKLCELAIIPLIILSGGLLEAFFEHPILYSVVFFTTILCCMVLATKED